MLQIQERLSKKKDATKSQNKKSTSNTSAVLRMNWSNKQFYILTHNNMFAISLCIVVICSLAISAANINNNTSTYNVTVYETVDSAPENVTVQLNELIHFDDDYFHLIIANQTIDKLSILINNELSILQILNCSLTKIEAGSLNITPTLTLLKISYNVLTSIENGVFNQLQVKELDLSYNIISQITADAFNSHLEILNVNHNSIKKIDGDWFRSSPNLYKFSIIYNELQEVPANSFQHMSTKKPLKLILSANRISNISSEAFNKTAKIDILRLNGNKLVELPDGIFEQTTINSLQINSNDMLCFPEALFKSDVKVLAFFENEQFKCRCLKKVRTFVETKAINVLYPAIICEDRDNLVNIVFNHNKTYEIPLHLPTKDQVLQSNSTQ